jgi:hypothetical protein
LWVCHRISTIDHWHVPLYIFATCFKPETGFLTSYAVVLFCVQCFEVRDGCLFCVQCFEGGFNQLVCYVSPGFPPPLSFGSHKKLTKMTINPMNLDPFLGSSWSYGSWIYNYLCNQSYHHKRCEFESHSDHTTYVIKFVTDLRQVDGFLRVLRFPPPIKLSATINIVESGAKQQYIGIVFWTNIVLAYIFIDQPN